MLNKVKETIRRHQLLSPGDRVVVAVSGGPDSVCLLHVLHGLATEIGISLHVACLDHMFRGAESAEEAAFVGRLAESMGLPATIEAIDVPAYCRARGLSLPSGAREARYAFLDRAAMEAGATRIATGHTASDQAETFLLRMLRGAGLSGLSAIPPKRGIVVRPLIDVTREEVEAYLLRAGVPSRSDPSNAKPVYARNRVRLELLPLLRQFNPRIVETLAAEAGLLREEDAAADLRTEELAQDSIVMSGAQVGLLRDRFNGLPVAMRRRLLRKAYAMAGGAADLSLVQVDEAIDFIGTAQTGRAVALPAGMTIMREYDRCLFRRAGHPAPFAAVLVVPGSTRVPELGIEITTMLHSRKEEGPDMQPPEKTGAENYLWQAVFDYDKIGSEIVVRSRAAGDRFCPAGMGGKGKKLQDFLVDARVPRSDRDSIPILATREAVLWVIGMRTDERFLPGLGTNRLLSVAVRHNVSDLNESNRMT